jgi:predicted metal-binding protein
MTLGNAAAARVRLIVWCEACQHRVEPDPAVGPAGVVKLNKRTTKLAQD